MVIAATRTTPCDVFNQFLQFNKITLKKNHMDKLLNFYFSLLYHFFFFFLLSYCNIIRSIASCIL